MKAGKKIRGITKEANKSLSVLLPLSPPPPSPPPQWRSLLFLVALLAGWWGEAMNKKKARTGTRGEGNPGIDTEKDTEGTGERRLDTDKDGVSLAPARWKRRKSEDQRERKV